MLWGWRRGLGRWVWALRIQVGYKGLWGKGYQILDVGLSAVFYRGYGDLTVAGKCNRRIGYWESVCLYGAVQTATFLL